ncbi:hypothetical protein LEP1GSC041_2546 [Leptospira noguchii str. 2006001870]|nr:hypothetical protein LEP1GSC041_2546 [Leptospira noguchii str. 2006001870]
MENSFFNNSNIINSFIIFGTVIEQRAYFNQLIKLLNLNILIT